jgi:hypothetical protein
LRFYRYAEFTGTVESDSKIIHGIISNPGEGAVEIIVPHFWEELVFDPNFRYLFYLFSNFFDLCLLSYYSLLVTDLKTSAKGCFNKNKLATWAIALISILGTFGVVAITVGVSFYSFFVFT